MREYTSRQSYERLTADGGSEEVVLEFTGSVESDCMWINEVGVVVDFDNQDHFDPIDEDTAEALIGQEEWKRMADDARQDMIEQWTQGE